MDEDEGVRDVSQPAKERMSGHVEIAYKDAIDNIIFSKEQQWKITNYALLAYGAVVAVARFNEPIRQAVDQKLPVLMIAIIFIFGLYVLVVLQSGITKFRSRLAWIYATYFSEAEICGLALSVSEKSFWYQPAIFFGLLFSLLSGGFLSCFILVI